MKNIRAISSIIGSLFHQFTLFSLFAFANICVQYGEKKYPTVKKIAFFFLSPICNIYMCLACFLGGISLRKLGIHLSIILGCISICLCSFLLLITNNIYLDYFVIIFYGLGFGISMTSSVSNACMYYPENRGLITAICGGVGGNLGSALCNYIIGKYKDEPWNYFKFHIALMVIGTLISVLTIRNYRENLENNDISKNTNALIEDEKNKNINNTESTEGNDNENQPAIQEKDIELKVILKNFRIYYILLIFFFSCFVQGYIMTVGFAYGTRKVQIGSFSEMGIIFTIMSLTGCIAGPFWGFIHDKLHFQKTVMLVNLLSMLNSAFIYFAKDSIYLYGILIILNGNLNTGSFAMIFPHVSKVFGFKYAGEMYAIVVLSTGISSLVASILLGCVFEDISSCLSIFFVGSAFNVIGFILCFFENDNKFME